jgi:hypothetical protein
MPPDDPVPFAARDASGESGDDGEEYVFRFALKPDSTDGSGYSDPLLELIRGQLADLLDAVVLTEGGRRVRVDGFRLLQDPDTQYAVFPDAGRAPGGGDSEDD